MSVQQNQLALKLRSLHIPGKPLVLANCYDAATAAEVAKHPSTKAIATASYGISAIQGVDDNDLTLEENFLLVKFVAPVAKRAGLPLTVDLQDGFLNVKETVKRAISLGAVGGNLEDLNNQAGSPSLRSKEDAVERIKEAVRAAKEEGVPDFCINARTDVLACGGSLEEAIERGKAYLAAGALTVYVWGGSAGRGVATSELRQLVEAFDGMLNVKMKLSSDFLDSRELTEIGVARISIGPELFHKAMGGFRDGLSTVYQDKDT